MALNANVSCANGIELFGIDDVGGGGMSDVFAARTVALFASHIPLGHLHGLQVVVHRVTTIAGGSGGTIFIWLGIKLDPPVSAIGHVVWEPLLILDVPLCRQGVITVSLSGEIALLPPAAIDECDLAEFERAVWIGVLKSPRTASGCSFGSRTTFAIRVCFSGRIPSGGICDSFPIP